MHVLAGYVCNIIQYTYVLNEFIFLLYLINIDRPALFIYSSFLNGSPKYQLLHTLAYFLFVQRRLRLCNKHLILTAQRCQLKVNKQASGTTQGLLTITSGSIPLFNSKMGIDRRVSGSSSQIFIFTVKNMCSRSHVSVFFGQSEINDK